LEVTATTAPPLMRIRYRPDATVFKSSDLRADFLPVCGRTRDLAAFHPHVRFTLDNENDGQRRDFHYPAGLLSLAQELEYQWWNGLKGAPRVWHCRLSEGTESAEAVFVCRPCGPLALHSFVNGYRTQPEGTHIDALRAGVAALAAAYPPDDDTNPFTFMLFPEPRDPLGELTVLLAVQLDRPEFRGSTRDVLIGERPRELVRRMVIEQLPGEIKRRAET
jgi:DNA gyrase/topoisomerase IV subunit B